MYRHWQVQTILSTCCRYTSASCHRHQQPAQVGKCHGNSQDQMVPPAKCTEPPEAAIARSAHIACPQPGSNHHSPYSIHSTSGEAYTHTLLSSNISHASIEVYRKMCNHPQGGPSATKKIACSAVSHIQSLMHGMQTCCFEFLPRCRPVDCLMTVHISG